jgi:hypothetical protein
MVKNCIGRSFTFCSPHEMLFSNPDTDNQMSFVLVENETEEEDL